MTSPIKRKIFYIPGFDPRSPAHYKKLLFQNFPDIKRIAEVQNKVQFHYQLDNLSVDYEMLSWHENVNGHWDNSVKGNFKNVYTLFKEFVFKGGYYRGFKVNFKRALNTSYPINLYIIWLIVSAFIFLGLTQNFYAAYGEKGLLLGVTLWLLINAVIYKLFDVGYLFWITRIMWFFAVYGNKQVPDILEREKEFQKKIIAALESNEFDEVVLVGHSVGTVLTVDILADLESQKKAKNLNVITLGHCVSGVYVVKDAHWFREKLASLSNRDAFWVDVTAARDVVSFFKVNPAFYEASKPDVTLSARFHRTHKKSVYDKVKWNFYKLHSLYLYNCCFPEKSEFNYHKLLTDPMLIKNLKEGQA